MNEKRKVFKLSGTNEVEITFDEIQNGDIIRMEEFNGEPVKYKDEVWMYVDKAPYKVKKTGLLSVEIMTLKEYNAWQQQIRLTEEALL